MTPARPSDQERRAGAPRKEISSMARQTTVHHIPRHAGWPNGEPQSVRDAYDRMLAEQAGQDGDKRDGKS
ncbi:hypothetical protein GCM10010466_37760 [Planomonospora alba]|uniref:Uncharacterized protein n=2 Tax=Planomonospora TaxID=1998 RepID=A0ABP6NC09_9ACTN